MLADAEGSVRRHVVIALGKLGNPCAISPLKPVAIADADESVRRAAQKVLLNI